MVPVPGTARCGVQLMPSVERQTHTESSGLMPFHASTTEPPHAHTTGDESVPMPWTGRCGCQPYNARIDWMSSAPSASWPLVFGHIIDAGWCCAAALAHGRSRASRR